MEELKAIWDAADSRIRCFIALGLNVGMYQGDISDLINRYIDWDGGYMDRPRSKTNVQAKHKLWDITLSLLKYHRCSEGLEDRVFFSNVYRSRRGKMRIREGKKPLPLVRREMVNGKFRHTDTIANAWDRVLKKAGLEGRGFSSLRDTGASIIEQIDPLATEMHLAHSEPGLKSHYAQRDWARLERALIEMWQRLKNVLAVPAAESCLQPFSSHEPNGPAGQSSPAAPDAPGADNYSWLA